MRLQRIGLTGGIGSGKSTVAGIWRDAGAWVIDLDQHSRAVLDVPGLGVEEAVARFGEKYRTEGGTIDRQALARLVFADDRARADLERIVLGRVDEAVQQQEAAARAAGAPMIAHDNPLLLEKHRENEYDVVVGVIAPLEARIDRVVRDRGRDRGYVESVLAAQVTDLERIHRCDLLVLNNAGLSELHERALHALGRATGRRWSVTPAS